MTVTVRRLDIDNAADRRTFVRFPFRHYRNDERWVPPLLININGDLRRGNPFYEHSEADFFVAESGGEVVGRVAAIENRRFNEYKDARSSFFGYFETVDDTEVSSVLLDTAASWGQDRGLEVMYGPRGVGATDGGLLVEGFEYDPTLGNTYNFPYYGDHVERFGLTKKADYRSGHMDPFKFRVPDRLHKIHDRVLARGQYSLMNFENRRQLRAWAPKIAKAYLGAVSELETFYPPTKRELEGIMRTLLIIAKPEFISLVLFEERIVGFLFSYPDLNPAIKESKGRLAPFGWARILRERAEPRGVNINGLGVLPEHRGSGANALLYVRAEHVLGNRVPNAEAVQVGEHNVASTKDMAAMGIVMIKRHRHYEMKL